MNELVKVSFYCTNTCTGKLRSHQLLVINDLQLIDRKRHRCRFASSHAA